MLNVNADEIHKLTIEEVKQFRGFSLMEDADIELVINNLYMLSLLCYEFNQSNNTE